MKKSYTFRLEEKVKETLENQATKNHRSQAGQIEHLIEQEERKNKK